MFQRLKGVCTLVLSASFVGVGLAQSEVYVDISVKRQLEPNYPAWAYREGIGQGYAKIAFYVDEFGETSEYLAIEYSHEAFAEELLKSVLHWDFIPAHRSGKPIKGVCHAYWEFLPDRPIETNALFDTSKRIDGNDAKGYRTRRFYKENQLDNPLRMIHFPGVVIGLDQVISNPEGKQIVVKCNFFVDTDGGVSLPLVTESSDPELNDLVTSAFRNATFEIPHVEGKQALVWVEKTYAIPVLIGEGEIPTFL